MDLLPLSSVLEGYTLFTTPGWGPIEGPCLSMDTLNFARSFLDSLPITMPKPDACMNAAGTISLEWRPDPTHGRMRRIDGVVRVNMTLGPGRKFSACFQRKDGEFGRFEGTECDHHTRDTLLRLIGESPERGAVMRLTSTSDSASYPAVDGGGKPPQEVLDLPDTDQIYSMKLDELSAYILLIVEPTTRIGFLAAMKMNQFMADSALRLAKGELARGRTGDKG